MFLLYIDQQNHNLRKQMNFLKTYSSSYVIFYFKYNKNKYFCIVFR